MSSIRGDPHHQFHPRPMLSSIRTIQRLDSLACGATNGRYLRPAIYWRSERADFGDGVPQREVMGAIERVGDGGRGIDAERVVDRGGNVLRGHGI